MSATPAPLEQSGTEARTVDLARAQQLAADLLALSRNAATDVAASDEANYGYRLGQRDAYAHAAGLLLASELEQDPSTITDWVTAAHDAKVTDGTRQHSAEYDLNRDGATTTTTTTTTATTAVAVAAAAVAAETVLVWVGPRAFAARIGNAPGVDHHYGGTWGPRGDRRISLRISDGADTGLLYVYDPTWDEYAVLADSADQPAVTRAFAAVEADGHFDTRHLDARHLAQLVNNAADRRPAPSLRATEPVRAEL